MASKYQLSAQRVPAGFGKNQARTPDPAESDDATGSSSSSSSVVENVKSASSSSRQQSVQSKGHRRKHRSRSRSSSGSSSSEEENPSKGLRMRTDKRDKERAKEIKNARKLKKIQDSEYEEQRKSVVMMGSSSKVGSSGGGGGVATIASKDGLGGDGASNVILVNQLRPYSESVKKDVTEYIVRVDKSVSQIAAECDENGDINISLADGISIERTVPAIDQKVMSLAAMHSANDLHANPSKFRSNNSILYDAKIITSHNSFPCSLKFTIPSLVGSSKDIAYTGNDADQKQALTFSLQKNEKLNNHVILTNNNFEKDNFNFFSAFPLFTESNLRDGVVPTVPTRDGLERVLVPHSQEKMHPVVTLAQMDIARTLSASERKQYGNVIPPHLISSSKEFPDHYILAKSVFETYHQRCADGLRAGNPLSDIANPHGKMSLGNKSLFSKKGVHGGGAGSNKTRLDSASNVQSSAKAAWTNNPELNVGRTTQSKKDAAKDTVYSAYARIQVRSVQTANLADLADD